MQALARLLTHDDPSQLLFQIAEIAGDRCYERHGVEVRPGATVLDVGANVGVAAAHFAVNCGAGRVHCFEPVAPVVELLRRNVGALPACVVHPYGLAAEDGDATVTYYPGATAMSGLHADPARDEALVRQALANLGHAGAAAEAQLSGRYRPQELTCRLRTLSGVLHEEGIGRVDLLKVDVERAELAVLRGIAPADWPRIEQVVAEVHDADGGLAVVQALLRAQGFSVACEQEAVMRGTDVHLVWARRG